MRVKPNADLALSAAPVAHAVDYPTTVVGQNPAAYWRFNTTAPTQPSITTAPNLGSLGAADNGTYAGNQGFFRSAPGAIAGDSGVFLDGGTQAYVNKVNRSDIPLDKILSNILTLGRQRPVVIQSLFPAINNEEPPLEEVEQYSHRLLELKNAGAKISLVQIYSATRPSLNSESGHLPLRVLSRIAQTVRQTTGLKAEVF